MTVMLLIFSGNNASFKTKQKLAGQTDNNETKGVETMVPLKYLSSFWRALEMPLIDFEINLILTWSANCFMVVGTIDGKVTAFTTNSWDFINSRHSKLLQQLKLGLERRTSKNKYQ